MGFNLLVVLSKNYAIKYDDICPFTSEEYFKYFNNLTKDGVIIYGRKTYESLPLTRRPLGDAINVVLSNEYPKYQVMTNNKLIFTNVFGISNNLINAYPDKQFWVIGGLSVYQSLGNMCDMITIVHLDKTVPSPKMYFVDILPLYEIQGFTEKRYSVDEKCNYRILHLKRNPTSPSLLHESQYLNTLRNLIIDGQARDDRTGVGTISTFGGQQMYDVSQYLPILTTKFVPLTIIIKELLWFLRGDTDAKILQKDGVKIWDGNSSREFLDNRGLQHYEEGDLGSIYSFQWLHFGAEYKNCKTDYSGKGFNQIEYIIDLLKNDPFSRRILMSSWSPPDLEKMALPPCHILFQLYVEEDPNTSVRYVSGHLYQRSSDYFLAANYNLVSYTILLYILCKKVGYYPRKMFMSFGDLHVYKNHLDQVKIQLGRNPRPQPILQLSDSIATKSFAEMTVNDFELIGYFPQPAIKAPMAV